MHDLDARVQAGHINKEDAELLKNYLFSLRAVRGVHPHTIETAYRSILPWVEHLSFSSMTLQDFHRARALLDQKGLKRNTLRTYITHMRRFCLWLIEQDHLSIDPKDIQKIKAPAPDHMTKQAAQMLTEKEVKSIIESSGRIRDRAFLSMLYEGGFRPVELVNLTWDQVKFDEWGLVVNTDKKTGVPRYVRLISSKDYLTTWRQEWPGEKGNRVFVTLRRPAQPLTHRGFKEIMKRAVRLAGLDKKVSLYLFRHSRITNMIEQGIPESVIKLQHWGSLNTLMLSTYAHVTSEHQDRVLLEHAGIQKTSKKAEAAMGPRQCMNCHHINAPTMNFCGVCGLGLTEEIRLSLEQQNKAVQESERYRQMFEDALNRITVLEDRINRSD